MYFRFSLHHLKTSVAVVVIICVLIILFIHRQNHQGLFLRRGTQFFVFLWQLFKLSNRYFKTSFSLEDIMICLRTSSKHSNRLTTILKTWVPLAWKSVIIVTDHYDDRKVSKKFESQWINANCKPAHRRKDLCCKMETEFDLFINSHKRWLCHVDDDSYLNIPALVKLLSHYDDRNDLYIGKPSVSETQLENVTFQFATGGAGFCLSKSLVLKMSSYILNNKFVKLCEKLFLPDDCSIGYIINHLLQVNLTTIQWFHSHLENLSLINIETLSDQISFSYSYKGNVTNVVSITGFSLDADPNRFFSIHCRLHSDSEECLRLKDTMHWMD